jgi:hypothetical protein
MQNSLKTKMNDFMVLPDSINLFWESSPTPIDDLGLQYN